MFWIAEYISRKTLYRAEEGTKLATMQNRFIYVHVGIN
jgi:hypothetical protein